MPIETIQVPCVQPRVGPARAVLPATRGKRVRFNMSFSGLGYHPLRYLRGIARSFELLSFSLVKGSVLIVGRSPPVHDSRSQRDEAASVWVN